MKILVSGKNSQIGREFFKITKDSKNKYIFKNSVSMNLLDEAIVRNTILDIKPDIIINFSAFTEVDNCETEKNKAYKINAIAPGIMASAASTINAILIHISTDYIFGKGNTGPFNYNSDVNPENYYGLSKLDGEKAILNLNSKSIIIRTASVFSGFGNNFVKTISKKVLSGSDVDVINNQMISVTYARDIATAIKDLLEKNILFNSKKNTPLVFHYTNNGYTNWYDLAVFISKELKEKGSKIGVVRPISSSEWASKAIRPADSRLCLDYHVLDSLNIKVFDWHERVSQVLHELYQSEGKKND
jgi:dTDP-4-dehydrorhamnose reductase